MYSAAPIYARAVQELREGAELRVVDGSKPVLFEALLQMALAGVARLGSLEIPPTVGKAHDDELGAPQIPSVDFLEDGSLGVNRPIRVAAAPRPRPHPICGDSEDIAPLEHKGDMEFRVVGAVDAAEVQKRLDLALGQPRHLCTHRANQSIG